MGRDLEFWRIAMSEPPELLNNSHRRRS
jgi:hypothetical protein